jgi:tetratricopeptide (TPR) repeat protein
MQLAADFPTLHSYRQDLATSHDNLGRLLGATGRPNDAERACRDALAIRKQLAADFPTMPDYQNALAGTLVNLADLRLRSSQFGEARRLLEDAVPYHQAALRANPRQPAYRRSFRNNRSSLAQTLVGLLDHAAAAKMTEELLKASVDPANDTYNAACYLSLCVPLAEKDSKLTEVERRTQAQGYADRAMAFLRQALAKGFNDADYMAKDDDLAPLRQRPDYQALLKEMEKAKPANK